ncbi:flavin reductase family protein [Limimaricola cinnabarinus]|jgi:flavin reductase (DIM6/NTAB) family NADH-FMN oxidoreductase RutF|uniref:Flavin oxidoreductase n=1 Tax=Limimaricola cinnabarinus TaxID=1125964 RepID=A0A2G1MFR6_9RHOB|nr:flavin reductase family protein [Limimaricola cinnabarinus]PHP27603.1 flavin oxidoreductase [Limimaricola cinnabarinus]
MSGAAETTGFVPDAENTRLLRDAFGRFTTGVTIVTVAGEDGPVAITANSFSSLSLDPPLVLWSPDKGSRRFGHFAHATNYVIHVLAADQADLCFGVSKDAWTLGAHDLELNAAGVPVIPGALARFDCTREATHEGGDHVIVVGRVDRCELRDGAPLVFYAGKTVRLAQD